jgi:hypothetical protein
MLAGALLGALAMCLRVGELGARMFDTAMLGILGLGGVQGIRSTVEHAMKQWKERYQPPPATPPAPEPPK